MSALPLSNGQTILSVIQQHVRVYPRKREIARIKHSAKPHQTGQKDLLFATFVVLYTSEGS
jgi:hypothetical protein